MTVAIAELFVKLISLDETSAANNIVVADITLAVIDNDKLVAGASGGPMVHIPVELT